MIRITVQAVSSGRRALCFLRGERKQTCGMCDQADIGPWLGFACAFCGAIAVQVEADTPDEAAAIEVWLYEHMELLVKRSLAAAGGSPPPTPRREPQRPIPPANAPEKGIAFVESETDKARRAIAATSQLEEIRQKFNAGRKT